MRSVKSLIAAGAASLLSSAAFAADMPIMPPPMPYAPPPVQDFGGWYLRGDIGMTNSTGKLYNNNYSQVPAGGLQQLGEGFSGGMSYGLGVGYQFNSWFRADITGEYRSRVNFSGTDIATFPGNSVFSDVYAGGYTSWVGLVNVYADLGTWWCLTPFIGAGVGAANIQTTGIQDSGSSFSPATGAVGGASYFANGASTTNFAWAAYAGVAYKVDRNFTVELAYRYLDMGTAVHGYGQSFDGSNAGPSSFQYRDLISQDVKLGVRFAFPCCEEVPPPPPPLIRKG
jgi:opacity protein-like surface antigen